MTQDNIITSKEVAIIGSGPAGLTAAVYAARYRLDQILIGELDGGLMTSSHKICNYPSETDISGWDLTQKMLDHVQALAVPHQNAAVLAIDRTGDLFNLKLSNGETVSAKNILLATGTIHRHLELAGEERLIGRGVSYCATCDAMFYANKIVAVVGGSDSANTAALYLATVAAKVYQIYRGRELRGEVAWIEQIKSNSKIEVLLETNITELLGVEKLTAIKLDRPVNGQTELVLDGLFVETGSVPDLTLINSLGLEVDEGNYIKTGPDQRTNQPGIWAAGDITTNSNSFRQIITACAEGAVAAQSIFSAVQKNNRSN
jgi:thioredoxin reductase (NADPH)